MCPLTRSHIAAVFLPPRLALAVDVGALIIFEIALQARDDRIWTRTPIRKEVVLAQPPLHSDFAHFLVEVGQPQ